MREHGLTLIELLVVLFIIGLGWFTLLPRLDVSSAKNDPVHQINSLLESAAHTARYTSTRQRLMLFPGRDYVEWNDQKAELPGILSMAKINGKPVSGSSQEFSVYPAGHMDALLIVFTDGAEFNSRPLLRRIE